MQFRFSIFSAGHDHLLLSSFATEAKIQRVKYVMTYIKENININEHRRVKVKFNNKNIKKVSFVTGISATKFSKTEFVKLN